ncbi:helix-turn-helix domain-containing protein [Sphingomonas bacterium]|uniref:helix-turn-helix domain-containing protein n=1 Tax=Sphingomonas bacterium TaxID=1895847 RepID=UPI0015754D0A|nr:XRE family transcriptional regulator [Sphingomonas bacterium]
MTPLPITPGAYIKLRRCAAGLSVADVAARLPTDPATAEHLRVEQLELIEADAQPMTLSTIMALRAIYPFDVQVLARLEALAQRQDLPEPCLCRLCGSWRAGNQGDPIQELCHACFQADPPERLDAYVASIRPAYLDAPGAA